MNSERCILFNFHVAATAFTITPTIKRRTTYDWPRCASGVAVSRFCKIFKKLLVGGGRKKKNCFDSIIGSRVTFTFIRHTFSLTFNYALYILVTRNKWPMNNANYSCKMMKFLVKFFYGCEII